uniref:uncharacterized protein LOC120330108 n=1 Tax=Styela clava TaxID=7725 RepID=UPI0019394244|nr:uncharacterized protein LOC120330108 [Styela clava]
MEDKSLPKNENKSENDGSNYNEDVADVDELDGNFANVDNFFKTGFVYTTAEQVRKHVFESETVGWSWSVYNSGFYHTAIVIHLDGKPRYSANWGPVSETKLWEMRGHVKGEVTIGIENDGTETKEDGNKVHETSAKKLEKVTYKPIVGSINVDQNSQTKIDNMLDLLLNYDQEFYHLVDCNCRDHVLDILMKVVGNETEILPIKNDIESVKLSAEKFWEKRRIINRNDRD